MLIQPDCIPCILKMSIQAINNLGLEKEHHQDLFAEILSMAPFRPLSWETTSPELIESILNFIHHQTGNSDPFSREKTHQNQQMMKLYPVLKKIAADSPDSLYTAVQLAIFGNAIDTMMTDKPSDMETYISRKLEYPLDTKAFSDLKQKLETCCRVVMFGDNCGEIVFDRIFMEIVTNLYNTQFFFIVRTAPALNDATCLEATAAGLEQTARVLENGISGPLPGTRLSRCSKSVQRVVKEADLIISKGGGNFDTLQEENKHLRKQITFMLLSKCQPYVDYFGIKRHYPVLMNHHNP